jgi:hypothetical protein
LSLERALDAHFQLAEGDESWSARGEEPGESLALHWLPRLRPLAD